MKNIVFLLILSFFFVSLDAQDVYPFKVKIGERKLIEPQGFDVWVLKSNQFDKALADSKMLELVNQQVEQLEEKNRIAEAKSKEQRELIDTLSKDRDYYQKIWKEADTDFTTVSEKLKKEMKKRKFYQTSTFVSVGAVVLLLLLL